MQRRRRHGAGYPGQEGGEARPRLLRGRRRQDTVTGFSPGGGVRRRLVVGMGLEEEVDREGGGVDGDEEEEEPRDEAAEAVSVAMSSASHHRRRRAAVVSHSRADRGVSPRGTLGMPTCPDRGGESSRCVWLVGSDGCRVKPLYYGRSTCSVPDPHSSSSPLQRGRRRRSRRGGRRPPVESSRCSWGGMTGIRWTTEVGHGARNWRDELCRQQLQICSAACLTWPRCDSISAGAGRPSLKFSVV